MSDSLRRLGARQKKMNDESVCCRSSSFIREETVYYRKAFGRMTDVGKKLRLRS